MLQSLWLLKVQYYIYIARLAVRDREEIGSSTFL